MYISTYNINKNDNNNNNNNNLIINIFLNNITDYKKHSLIYNNVQSKQALFSKLVHEFKTPLITIQSLSLELINSINGISHNDSNFSNISNSKNNSTSSIESINQSKLTEIKKITNNIKCISQYVQFLINDIIYYTSKESIKINKEIIDVSEILLFCYSVSEALIDNMPGNRENVVTIINKDPQIDKYTCISDKTRLKQILLNFISNAVKFTKRGYIIIKASIVKQKKELDKNNLIYSNEESINKFDLELSIIDSGTGISNEYLKIINTKSNDNIINIKNNNTKNNDMGTGLGIGIAKNLIRKLDHDFLALSNNEEGSEFKVIIKDVVFKDHTIIINACENTNYNNETENYKINTSCLKLHNILNYKKDDNNNNNTAICNTDISKKSINDTTLLNTNTMNINYDYYKINNCNIINKIIDTQNISNYKKTNKRYSFYINERTNKRKSTLYSRKRNAFSRSSPLSKKVTMNIFNKSLKDKKALFSKQRNIKNPDKRTSIFDIKNPSNMNIKKKMSNIILNNISKLNSNKMTKPLINKNLIYKGKIFNQIQTYSNLNLLSSKQHQIDKIIIADDSKQSRKNIVKLVNIYTNKHFPGKYDIIECCDGIDVLKTVIDQQYKEGNIKLLITDELMDYMNGSSAVSILRSYIELKKIRSIDNIVSLTAYEDDESINNLLKKGSNRVITKPVEASVFNEVLNECLKFCKS